MKKELIMILLVGFVLMAAKPAVAADKNELVGSWKCTANDVPDEYKNSTIVIIEKDGKISGTVEFDNGVKINLNYVKQNGKDVVMSVYVDGNEVIINGKVEGSKITGTAVTPDGTVTITATKLEKKK